VYQSSRLAFAVHFTPPVVVPLKLIEVLSKARKQSLPSALDQHQSQHDAQYHSSCSRSSTVPYQDLLVHQAKIPASRAKHYTSPLEAKPIVQVLTGTTSSSSIADDTSCCSLDMHICVPNAVLMCRTFLAKRWASSCTVIAVSVESFYHACPLRIRLKSIQYFRYAHDWRKSTRAALSLLACCWPTNNGRGRSFDNNWCSTICY
jgi:hypothetical protein